MNVSLKTIISEIEENLNIGLSVDKLIEGQSYFSNNGVFEFWIKVYEGREYSLLRQFDIKEGYYCVRDSEKWSLALIDKSLRFYLNPKYMPLSLYDLFYEVPFK